MNTKYQNKRPCISAEIRRSIELESGHKCAIKGCPEHTYLEIHHINNNRENNSTENLILLCDKHHKMAHAGVIDRKSLQEYKRLNSTPAAKKSYLNCAEQSPQLRVVDLYELEYLGNDEEQITTIEVKLRNAGNEVIFLKEVIFETINHWEIITDKHHSLVNVSAKYDVNISTDVGNRSKIKVHQEIKPQETDRIQIRLSTDHDSDPDGLSLFLMNIVFVFNENSEKSYSGPAIFNIRPKTQSVGSYFPCYSSGTISKNKAIAKEVMNLNESGVNVEKYILSALSSWLNAPSEEEYFNKIRGA